MEKDFLVNVNWRPVYKGTGNEIVLVKNFRKLVHLINSEFYL